MLSPHLEKEEASDYPHRHQRLALYGLRMS
jgi:hypothetical protein